MKAVSNAPEAVLVLIRHGAIVRPTDTSNFDRAPLSSEGWRQMNSLVSAWLAEKPLAVYCSDLLRSIQSGTILQTAFHVPLIRRECLREWTADPSDLPQNDYMALERRAWQDFHWIPPSGESLAMAGERIARCLEGIALAHRGETVGVVGHGTVFSHFTTALRGDVPTERYKNSIPNACYAIVAHGDSWRLISDFATVDH